jgi:zinc protease
MRTMSRRLLCVLPILVWAPAASAQTASEVVDKCLTALGGRAALAKVTSRSSSGTITLSTPGGEVSGTVEVLNQAPNKVRTLIKVDLSSLGAGQLVFDQRFDGTAGYVMDSMQGNRDITGNQLDNLRNTSFPTPLLDYKALGMNVQLGAKETVGGRQAYVLTLEPPSGSVVRQYVDAETYLPIQVVVKAFVPQIGQDLEQTTALLDYRAVDGVKLPFEVRASSSVQSFTIVLTKVEHNVRIDGALFSKPANP